MSKIIKIYCEGKKGSHDYDILEKITDELFYVLIEPVGSVRGAGAIIQHKESEIVKSDFMILFRDRDFDKPIPAVPKLERDNQRDYVYYSYRNTIENYLFDIGVFFEFIEQENLKEKYSINSEEDVQRVFINSAERIKFYQAVRHTMGKIRTGKTDFGTKLTDKSGNLPDKLDEEYCINKALEKIRDVLSITDKWTEEYFRKVYHDFLSKFSDEFMNNLDFLIYFQGKDFASSLQATLLDFPLKKYYKYAKDYFDYKKFTDLIQLKKLIEQQ